MDESRIIKNMRHMAWERAKGEMNSMLHTFWGDGEAHDKLDSAISGFVEKIEGYGLYE